MSYMIMKTRKQARHYAATSTIGLLLCLLAAGLRLLTYQRNYYEGALYVENHLHIIPFMLLSALCGQTTGAFAVLIAFIAASIVNIEYAYVILIILVATLIAYAPVRSGWYKSWPKTILFIPIAATAVGLEIAFLTVILMDAPLTGWLCAAHVIGMLPVSAFVAAACYLFFNYAPPAIRAYVSSGAFYDASAPGPRSENSRLSRKITYLILIEAFILTAAATFFANVLFGQESRILSGPQFLDWLRIKSNFMFDVKLIILMANITVPIVLIANSFAQQTIALPIRMMAIAMDDFSNDTAKEEQAAVLDIHLLHINTKDEITDLHRTLKKTVSTVTSYIARLQQEEQLKADLKVAQEASKAKTSFLSNMSHEIRTPINAVLGFDEMILRESREPQTLSYANDIRTSGKTLLSLINDILDFSKIESGKLEIIPTEYDLSSTINDLVNMIAQRAKDKGLKLAVNVDEKTPHLLFGDEIRIKQCILNILTNAVKYTKEGSVTMTVSWQQLDDERISLRAEVADTGIGIKQEDIPKLFHAFERIEEKRNRTIEGTGLGMNIVQQLLGLMGTRLEVESVYGAGSTFAFSIIQKVVKWDPIGNFALTYEKTLAENSGYRETFHAPDARILVVDDTPLNLTVVQGLLKQTQITVDTADSGFAALGRVKDRRYDAIFLDHRMPRMDGIETLHAMQELEGNQCRGVPCIALTANAVAGAREMYLAEGFTDYLTKPIESIKLERMLMDYLPPHKVQKVAAEDAAAGAAPGDGAAAQGLDGVTGIDVAQALKNCGGADLLKTVIGDYYRAIAEKSAQIEAYWKQKDFRNYTILVHALKSSSRLIGAMELSRLAEQLEACGNREDAAEIDARTPELLRLYRSYAEHLAPIAGGGDGAAKPPLGRDKYRQALADLKGCAEAFDCDTADRLIEMLDQYRVPDGEEERFQRIKAAAANVDYAALAALL